MHNHLFIVLAHNQPELLRRIVGRLEASNHYFYLHIDKKVNIMPFKSMITNLNIDWCEDNRVIVNWGGYSQIQCTLNLIRKAITDNHHFDYIHLISGSDYPCYSNEAFDLFFENSGDKSFMHFDAPEDVQNWRKDKYPDRMKWYFRDNKILEKIKLNLIMNIFFPRKPLSNIYGGWQWFSWHRSVAEYVLRYVEQNKKYLLRFKFTSCCDELFFHTMLFSVADQLNIEKYNSLRYIDWHPVRSYKSLPLVLNMQDAELIKNSGCFFCRKCSLEESNGLMDYLDTQSSIKTK